MREEFLLVAVVAVFAVGAVALSQYRCRLVYVTLKTIASLAVVGVAYFGGALDTVWGSLVFAGSCVAFSGDIVMGAFRKRGLIAGIGCFMVAYAFYVGAFAVKGFGPIAVPAMVAAVVLAIIVWKYLMPHIPARMRIPVAAYSCLLIVLMATGVAVGVRHSHMGLAVGAVLLAVSDIAVARERFVAHSIANKVAGLPLYYLGQVLVVLAAGAS